jgi:serine/threonine protein kinase
MDRRVGNVLVAGAFSTIYLDNENPEEQVIKSVSIPSPEFMADLYREVENIRALSPHPNILPLVEFSVEEEVLWMVFPRYKCTMWDHSPHRVGMNESTASGFMAQLCDALIHCHSHGIMHRDVKTENIFLRPPPSFCHPMGGMHLVLGDFGSSRRFSSHENEKEEGRTYTLPITTSWYSAPEMLLDGRRDYTEKIDLWSAGCVLYEMITGVCLFQTIDDATLPRNVEAFLLSPASFSRYYVVLSQEMRDILSRFLCRDVAKRVDAVQARALFPTVTQS